MSERTIVELCHDWNVATNPAKLRTEDEHKECQEKARRAMAEIERRYRYGVHYTESDHTGRLIPR